MRLSTHAGTEYGLRLVAMTEKMHRSYDRKTHPRVYCIQSPGFFKVGFSTGIMQRIRAIQESIPYAVLPLFEADGGRATENAIHGYLSQHHYRGEWFTDCDESRAMVWKAFSSLPDFRSFEREAAELRAGIA